LRKRLKVIFFVIYGLWCFCRYFSNRNHEATDRFSAFHYFSGPFGVLGYLYPVTSWRVRSEGRWPRTVPYRTLNHGGHNGE